MDQRLQHIMEHYDEMLIGEDDTFQFHCDQCGKCCINREDILLNPKDLYNIARELGITPQEVVELYGETYLGQSSRLPIVRLKPRGSIKRCPLMKDRKCSVHKAKPVVCAMFPLGRCIRVDSDKYSAESLGDTEIQYIINSIDCGDRSETHTVREWLDAFSIPLQDESFIRWQKTIFTVGTVIHELEPIYGESGMDMVWSLIYFALYINYDMKQDFDEQFQENAEILIDALNDLPRYKGGKSSE